MRTVTRVRMCAASVADAEAHWYDTGRWIEWVDGLDAVVSVVGEWPGPGATVTWRSGPAGRGTVTEHVLAHEPLRGQTVQVADGSIRGEQTVAFVPDPPGVEVQLSLAYELLRRTPVTPIVDWLFIRAAMASSLDLTLARFAASLESAYPAPP